MGHMARQPEVPPDGLLGVALARDADVGWGEAGAVAGGLYGLRQELHLHAEGQVRGRHLLLLCVPLQAPVQLPLHGAHAANQCCPKLLLFTVSSISFSLSFFTSIKCSFSFYFYFSLYIRSHSLYPSIEFVLKFFFGKYYM